MAKHKKAPRTKSKSAGTSNPYLLWIKNWWSKIPNDVLAVSAVILMIAIGIVYNSYQVPGDNLKGIICAPGYSESSQCRDCISGYTKDGSNACVKQGNCPAGEVDVKGQCRLACEPNEFRNPGSGGCIEDTAANCSAIGNVKYEWDSQKNTCGCKIGYIMKNGFCEELTCAADEVVTKEGCYKKQPPNPRDICAAQGMDYDIFSGQCVPYTLKDPLQPIQPIGPLNPIGPFCQLWQKAQGDLCIDRCDTNSVWNSSSNQCEICLSGKKAGTNECNETPTIPTPTPIPFPTPLPEPICLNWEKSEAGQCVDRCPAGQIWDETAISPRCISCESGQKTNYNTCVAPAPKPDPTPTCKSWQVVNNKNQCENRCPSNAIWNGAICVQCASNKKDSNNQCVNETAPAVTLLTPADNTFVWKDDLEAGRIAFSWRSATSATKYRLQIFDSFGTTVINQDLTNTISYPTPDVDRYVNDSRDWTWKVGALVNNSWVWSNTWDFNVLEDTVPVNNDLDVDLDLSVDKYGEIDAEIKVRNTGTGSYSSDNIIFRIENITDRLDPVDYYYDRNGRPVFKINDLRRNDAPAVFDIDNLPNSRADGRKLFEVTMYDGNKVVATDRDDIDYDGRDYDPYRPRRGDLDRIPFGRQVEIRGFVERYGNNFVLVDRGSRLIAYLGNFREVNIVQHVGQAVEVLAFVDHYSCEGSTLEVIDIHELRRGESVDNSLAELYHAGAICYEDIDTRPVYDPVTGKLTVIVDEDNPWYLPYVIDMYERGIMKGDRSGVLDPARQISIAEVTKMATFSARVSVLDEIYCIERGEPWYCNVMALAADKGWLDRGALRNPDRPATREEVVQLVMKAFQQDPAYRSASFPDVDYSDREAGFIEGARIIGIISGYPDGTFRPDNAINRAEVAKIYSNAIRILAEGRAPVSNR